MPYSVIFHDLQMTLFYILLIFDQHSLWVYSLEPLAQSILDTNKKISNVFIYKIIIFTIFKNRCKLHRHVCVIPYLDIYIDGTHRVPVHV